MLLAANGLYSNASEVSWIACTYVTVIMVIMISRSVDALEIQYKTEYSSRHMK